MREILTWLPFGVFISCWFIRLLIPAAKIGLNRRGVTAKRLTVCALLSMAAALTGTCLLHIVRVSSASMSPFLLTGDLLLVHPVRDYQPARDAVIVALCRYGVVVKRVFGVGGDEVETTEHELRRNGTTVRWLPERIAPFGRHRVPTGNVFLIGDHATNSVDSRIFGDIPTRQILSVPFFRVWPPSRWGRI